VQCWPSSFSLFRVFQFQAKDDQQIRRAAERIDSFVRWAGITPGLEPIAKDHDALLAVAQHYGIPTHYIDFTTDPGVAGFFACDAAQPPETGTESCIYCVNTEDLNDVWEPYVPALKYVNYDFSSRSSSRRRI
jgi:FRG domain